MTMTFAEAIRLQKKVIRLRHAIRSVETAYKGYDSGLETAYEASSVILEHINRAAVTVQ